MGNNLFSTNFSTSLQVKLRLIFDPPFMKLDTCLIKEANTNIITLAANNNKYPEGLLQNQKTYSFAKYN